MKRFSFMQVLPRLKEKISIERARMRLKTVSPKGSDRDVASKLRDLLTSREASIESEDATGSQVINHVQPVPLKNTLSHNLYQSNWVALGS